MTYDNAQSLRREQTEEEPTFKRNAEHKTHMKAIITPGHTSNTPFVLAHGLVFVWLYCLRDFSGRRNYLSKILPTTA